MPSYEEEYDANVLAYLARHPEDPKREAFESRRRAWRTMYIEHGRGALGFALFQLRRAP